MRKHVYILSCQTDGGIYHYIFKDGSLEFVEKTPLDRPMYAIIRNGRMYVVTRELGDGTGRGCVLSFDIDGGGRLTNPTTAQSSGGIVPCHLEVTEDGTYVVNYLSGNIVKVGEKTATHSGKGVNPDRQEAPHTHFVAQSPDKKHILCVDLGVDKIYFYDADLNGDGFVKLPDGSGPRHLCFDGGYIYCITELSNEVFVIKDRKICGSYSSLLEKTCESYGAAIRKSGDFVYVSNRGADTICSYKADGDSLTLVASTDCGGCWPRDFDVIDDYIICTNEKSGSVTILKLENGKPILTDKKVEIGSPLCVVMKEEL